MSSSNNKTALQILIDAKGLIFDPKNFTQGAFARNKDGEGSSVYDDRATCFCGLGAFYRSGHLASGEYWNLAISTLEMSAVTLYPALQSVPVINDKLGHAAIIKVYAHAIEIWEAPVKRRGMLHLWHRIPETSDWIYNGQFNGDDARFRASQLLALGAAGILISSNANELKVLLGETQRSHTDDRA